MKHFTTLLAIILTLTLTSFSQGSFKEDQLTYPNVRQAYADKEQTVKGLLSENSIETENLRVYLRAFKLEKIMELWAKNKSDTAYKLIKEYDICRTSGVLGPKRKEGDGQIPEGFYKINVFNPSSKFYLSLGINYPNKSDRVLGVKGDLGGEIFIHGDCVTIGCMPITDDKIKELYIFCVEAKDHGQESIPVTVFPTKLTDENYKSIKNKQLSDQPKKLGVTPPSEKDKLELWADLKTAFDIFNETKQIPKVVFLDNGRCEVTK